MSWRKLSENPVPIAEGSAKQAVAPERLTQRTLSYRNRFSHLQV